MTDDTIPDFVTTIILDAIEQSPLPRAQFDLKELCNSNPSVFGTPGLAQRRRIQKKIQKLKAKPISTYLRTLKKSGVQPGDFTREEEALHSVGLTTKTTTTMTTTLTTRARSSSSKISRCHLQHPPFSVRLKVHIKICHFHCLLRSCNGNLDPSSAEAVDKSVKLITG